VSKYITEPIKKPNWNDGHFGPPGSFFYRVKDGEHWGSVAQRDGWSNPWDFIKYNFPDVTDPREVNWFLKNYVGCNVKKDGKNYSFSNSAKYGFVFTRHNLQPSMQRQAPVPAPPISPESDDGPLKQVYGPPRTWFAVGGKIGGMVGPKGGDVLGLSGIALDGSLDAFFSYGYTDRTGGGLGGGAGFIAGIVYSMQHPNQLFDITSKGWDVGISLGLGAGGAAKLAAHAAKLDGMARKVVSATVNSIVGSGPALSTFMTGLKGMGQILEKTFGPRGELSAVLIDVPFGSIGLEASVYEGVTKFRPMRTVTYTDEGYDDVIIW
jgi:hypothetical protein